VVGRALAVVVCALLLAGCGGAKQACQSPKEQRAAALPAPDKLKGNAAINRATDRFLRDVQTAPIDNLKRNRLIDHAAALLLGSCSQCFQALEAERPIVSIAHGDRGCPSS
jgi:hypothetical protein